MSNFETFFTDWGTVAVRGKGEAAYCSSAFAIGDVIYVAATGRFARMLEEKWHSRGAERVVCFSLKSLGLSSQEFSAAYRADPQQLADAIERTKAVQQILGEWR